MALTSASVRTDKKCGGSYISNNKKCSKVTGGKGQRAKSEGPGPRARGAATLAGRLAGIGGTALIGGAVFNNRPGSNPTRDLARGAALLSAASGLSKIGQGSTRQGLNQLGSAAAGAIVSEGALLAGRLRQARSLMRRANLERAYRGPSAKRDSVYAAGFSPEPDQLAI